MHKAEDYFALISCINEKPCLIKCLIVETGLLGHPMPKGVVEQWLKNEDEWCCTSKYIMEFTIPSKLGHRQNINS